MRKKVFSTNSARKIGEPYEKNKIKPQPHSTYTKVNSKYNTDLNVKDNYKIYRRTHRRKSLWPWKNDFLARI